MAIQQTTIKRLYAKSANKCAFPNCGAPIIVEQVPVGEMCHIRARRKNGPRYDPSLTPEQRDDFSNLLLLCRTCHKLIDSNPTRYTADLLRDIKEIHERSGHSEITPEIARDALLLLRPRAKGSRTSATAKGSGVAVAVGGNNHAPITITHTHLTKKPKAKYPENSIGADANLCGYVDYLFGLALDYWKKAENMNAGRLGKKIKDHFRIKSTKTRNHLSVDRFQELVHFIIDDLIRPSPVGRMHARNGTRACRTFDEWRHDPL
jgi:hypothetical protein